jgi:superoxide reductase
VNESERGKKMMMKEVGEKYRCNVCGNEVEVIKVGGGTLVCCGQEMEPIGR